MDCFVFVQVREAQAAARAAAEALTAKEAQLATLEQVRTHCCMQIELVLCVRLHHTPSACFLAASTSCCILYYYS